MQLIATQLQLSAEVLVLAGQSADALFVLIHLRLQRIHIL